MTVRIYTHPKMSHTIFHDKDTRNVLFHSGVEFVNFPEQSDVLIGNRKTQGDPEVTRRADGVDLSKPRYELAMAGHSRQQVHIYGKFWPVGVWLPRNEAKARLLASRSAAEAKAGADSVAASPPVPEVVAKAKRRTYTAEYKQRSLEEAKVVAATRGGVGALLRREGLYSWLLATWRRERANGIREALTPQRRRPKSKGPEAAPSGGSIDRKTPQSGDHHRRSKKSLRCWGTRFPTWTGTRNPDVRGHRTRVSTRSNTQWP